MAAVLLLVVLAQASMLDTGLCGPLGSRLEEGNSGLKKAGQAPHKNVSLEGVLELLQALDLVVKFHTKEASYNRSNTQQQENVTGHQPGRNMRKGHQNDAFHVDQPGRGMSLDQAGRGMSKGYQNDAFHVDQPDRGMSLDQAGRGMSKGYQNDAFHLDQAGRGMSLDLNDRDDDSFNVMV